MVAEILEREFEIDAQHSVDKRAELGSREFGYSGDHYVVSLSPSRQQLPEWKPFLQMCAEIQIRTATQHAWAAVERRLSYKSPHSTPSELQRRFYRLSALFELADEQFSDLRREHQDLTNRYEASVVGGDLEIPIDAASLGAYLEDAHTIEGFIADIAELGWQIQDPSKDAEAARRERRDLLRALEMTDVSVLREFDELLAERTVNRDILANLFTRARFTQHPRMLDEAMTLVVLLRRKASAEQVSELYSDATVERIVAS